MNAAVAKGVLASDESDPLDALTSAAPTSGTRAVLRLHSEWFSTGVELNATELPPEVVEHAEKGIASRQRVNINGAPYLVVGASLGGLDAEYFEFIPLAEYEHTLATLLAILLWAASLTTLAGAAAGWIASRQVLRPLSVFSVAARKMSEGDLKSRIVVGRDPDLQPLARSFNDMSRSLETRIAREARFTADVSHELRTPLTSVSAALALAQRASNLDEARFALDVLATQVEHLRQLTLELLEVARFDAGTAELHAEETDVVQLTERIVTTLGASTSIIVDHLGFGRFHAVDRTRFDRVVSNLLENAARYAGGATSLTLCRRDGSLVVMVDDEGPGVPISERLSIFGRFSRGSAAQSIDAPRGTGLGLSLADEHVTLHGGTISVEDSPDGGARFVAVFP